MLYTKYNPLSMAVRAYTKPHIDLSGMLMERTQPKGTFVLNFFVMYENNCNLHDNMLNFFT